MIRQTLRLLTIARKLAAHDALIPAEYALQAPFALRALGALARIGARRDPAKRPGERLAEALAELGPTTIKLGQFLATRPDVIGAELAADLSQLQDRLPPFPDAEARAAIAEAFGKPAEAVYAELSPPVAAASIAQVHKAVLPGAAPRTVAVKVLRPGVKALFARDLSAFAVAARLAEPFGGAEARRLRPAAAVETLARSVALELDLRFEAAAASEMAQAAANDPEFRVPAVDWALTRARVMTAEWIDGIKLNDRAALIAAGRDPARLANLVIRSFLRQALRDGFFHADLHPGNLFADAQGRLVAVDFGITGRLDAGMRRFMAETLGGFLARDYARIAAVHFEAGFVPAHHDRAGFAQALRAVGEPIWGRPAREVSMAQLLGQLFEITAIFGMRMQPQLLLLQKTMVVAEGVARGLDPDHNIWEASRPVVEDWMIAEMGPQARLREAAENMGTLGRAVSQLPAALQNLEQLSALVSDGGLKLHPETAQAIAAAEVQSTRHVRAAIWIGAAALALLALAGL